MRKIEIGNVGVGLEKPKIDLTTVPYPAWREFARRWLDCKHEHEVGNGIKGTPYLIRKIK